MKTLDVVILAPKWIIVSLNTLSSMLGRYSTLVSRNKTSSNYYHGTPQYAQSSPQWRHYKAAAIPNSPIMPTNPAAIPPVGRAASPLAVLAVPVRDEVAVLPSVCVPAAAAT